MATYTCSVPRVETEEMTRAAHVDSAKDPNRSAPIPAMSPTLSPTLSASSNVDVGGWKGEAGVSVGSMMSARGKCHV